MALAYFPSGTFLAILLNSVYTMTLTYWEWGFIFAPLVAIPGALVAAALLTISRSMSKRIVWLHSYLMGVGMILLLISGVVMVSRTYGFGKEIPYRPFLLYNSFSLQNTMPATTLEELAMALSTSLACPSSICAPVATSIGWLRSPCVT